MKSNINLRHLKVFIAVAESGGATKAAQALYRAQSAVTRSIQELESSLGAPLFERKATGMLPTVFGRTLLFRAKRAAQELELASHEIISGVTPGSRPLNAPVFSILFDENRLITFIELGKLRHMPTVAKLLGVTQQAVSATIAKLESSLGIPLFKRTARGMLLTEAGQLLFFRVKRALAELAHVRAEISVLSGTIEGRVTVGVTLGRSYILPRAIAKVVAVHPQLQVVTIEGSFDPLATDLRSGDIDFILGALRPPDYETDLVGEPLMSDKMAVFVRRDHPLTRLSRISIGDLLQARWILPNPGTLTHKLFDLSFASLNVKPPAAVVETSDLSILRHLLLNSDMVTAISLQWLYLERMSGELQVLNFELQKTERTIGITQRQKSHPSPGTVSLIEAIHQVVNELAQDPHHG
jgi:LysR family transcriptional regulator of gallate degradation